MSNVVDLPPPANEPPAPEPHGQKARDVLRSAEVLRFNSETTHNLDPDRVLTGAAEQGLDGCLVVGFDRDGDLYFASSYADGGTILWLLEKAKQRLLRVTGQ